MMAETKATIEEVIATERRWVQAHRDLDLDALDAIMSDDYRQIRSDGSVIGKSEALASYASLTRRWELAESDEYDLQVHHNVAVLIGRWTGRGENAGELFDYRARFMAIYVRTPDGWKLIADQATPIS
jgi:ketosteroid isomerase-like protein